MVMQGYPNANFANGREWTRITAFVIPNAEGHPPLPPFKGGKERKRSVGEKAIFPLGGL